MNKPPAWTPELVASIRDEALRAGFVRVGIVEAVAEGLSVAAADDSDSERFVQWVEAGYAGEMEYLKRKNEANRYLREDVRQAAPWARSVIVCAFNYGGSQPRSIDFASTTSGWIARYAQTGRTSTAMESAKARPAQLMNLTEPTGPPASVPTDYHIELLERLRQIEHSLQQQMPCESRCYVDTGPIVERTLATRAGIGWIGKNTCVIDQELGSWLLLGVILTSLEAAPTVPFTADRCGSCTRCIDACPTDALIAPRQMDASRCIAYLTIEKKGPIAEDLRTAMGRQVFGCDICQDVCPWNNRGHQNDRPLARGGLAPQAAGMEARPELINPPLAQLAAMDPASFKRWFKGSPLERTGRRRLHRNVAIAMGNSGEEAFRPQLAIWAEADDPVLADAARWAIEALNRT